MRPAVLTVAVAVLAAASAYQLDLENYWPKLNSVHSMTRCLGQKATGSYIKLILKSLQDCDKVPSGPVYDQTIGSLQAADWNRIFNEFSPRFYLKNEFPANNTERIANVKGKISYLIRRFRCTMQRMKFTDSSNNINKDGIVEFYKSMGLSQPLFDDIASGVVECHRLTQCLPQGQPNNSPIPKDVWLVKSYLNCERYLRNWTCLKNYLEGAVGAGEFDFSGADGTLDFLPSDAARAATIALANELVGGDDYGLFE